MVNIANLLACPLCKGSLELKVDTEDELGIQEGELLCQDCHGKYHIREGVLYLKKDVPVRKNDTGPAWSLKEMEDLYSQTGYYKTAKEFYKRSGYPEIVSEYDYPKVKGRILEWLRPRNNNVIVDIGCGVGYFLFEMIKKYPSTKMTLIGLDVIENRVRFLMQRKKEEGVKNIFGIVGDGMELPFRNNRIDLVTCSEVLEHIFTPQKAIAEMARILKPGGNLLISTPSKRAEESWDFITAPLRKIKSVTRAIKGERKEIRKRYYDYPIYSEKLKNYLKSNECNILKFELNVILPPQEYFKKIPNFILKFVVTICKFLECHFKKVLCNRWALHSVVLSQKEKYHRE